MTKKATPGEIKKILAVQYFKERRLSLGKGAELAGMSKNAFVGLLSENEIDIFNYIEKKYEDELDTVFGFVKEYKNNESGNKFGK